MYLKLFLVLVSYFLLACNDHVSCAEPHPVKYYEHLTYDHIELDRHHHRSRRSLSETGSRIPFHLKFKAHDHHFNLRLSHDSSTFHKDFVLENEVGDDVHHDLSHLYGGVIYGVPGSYVHGTIIDGIFRGHMYHPSKGYYYMEENYMFFGANSGVSPITGYTGHSVIYRQKDVDFPNKYSTPHTCGHSDHEIHSRMERIQNYTQQTQQEQGSSSANQTRSRSKRAVFETKTKCLLYIQTDWVLYKDIAQGNGVNPRELIISKIADHVQMLNKIYFATDFNGVKGIGFIVKRLRVNDTKEGSGRYFRQNNIGVESFLNYASMDNFNDYCLAYVFTSRDFDNGVLGLAWVADPGHKTGGICEKYQRLPEGFKSLNTGIVTFKNYGRIMPSAVSHITFAHEVGHNFGSPHDSGYQCSPDDYYNYGKGNFIMYARATSGDKPNNVLFSPCSKGNISAVLHNIKDNCFVADDIEICGNGIVEEGEECDCGFEDDCTREGVADKCCTPAGLPNECKYKTGYTCSPSNGPCCDENTCNYRAKGYRCAMATDCRGDSTCNGSSTECQPGLPLPNNDDGSPIECAYKTKLCKNGECSASRCELDDDFEACECTVPEESEDRSKLCHTCCKRKTDDVTKCMSIGDTPFGNNTVIYLQPGSPCDNNNGYCDVFSKCRHVDADGPLSRIKQALFNPMLYSSIRKWIVTYYWAVALMGVALLLLMVGFVRLCSVHTPTSNPSLPKHKQLPGAETLRRRRQYMQQRRQSRTNTVDVEMQRRR